MAILKFAACSSTAARPRSLLRSRHVAGAQVRGAATHRALLAVGFSRLDQTVKLSAGRRAFGYVAEPPTLAPDHEGLDRTLGGIVVDRQVTGFGVAHQLAPVSGQVADGFAQCILHRHLWLGFLQPGVQLRQHR